MHHLDHQDNPLSFLRALSAAFVGVVSALRPFLYVCAFLVLPLAVFSPAVLPWCLILALSSCAILSLWSFLRVQVSMFLPNEQCMDDWYSGVLCPAHSVAKCLHDGTNNLRKAVGYDFHHIRKKYDVPRNLG